MGGRDDAVQAYFSAFVEENPAWQSLAAVIAERTGAYIEDKAHALGTEVTAEVTVREEDGAFIPDRAVLFGEENTELSALLTQELGIAPEKQEWRAER